MKKFGGDEKQDNHEEYPLDPEVTSSFASYEAALREALETGTEKIPELPELGDQHVGKPSFQVNLSWLLPATGFVVVLVLAWYFGLGPMSPMVRQWIAQLNERANAPISSGTAVPTLEGTAEIAAVSLPTATPTRAPSATSTTESAVVSIASSPTPSNTNTPVPSLTPTSSVAGCVPAASITLEDVGKELCVTASVFRAEVLETYFSVRTGEDFYYVSYAKGWYASYGTTWELEKGDCVYATGKIEKIGSYPLMQVGYKNPLERCPQP